MNKHAILRRRSQADDSLRHLGFMEIVLVITVILARFPVLIFGASAGWLSARAAVWIMALFGRYELAQISISVALPYLAFIAAGQSIGASGFIAVVAAELPLNRTGSGRLPPQAWTNLRELWNVLALWAGALILILSAHLIPRLLEEVRIENFVLVGVLMLAAMTARAVILFGPLPLLAILKLSPAVEWLYGRRSSGVACAVR